MRRTISKSGSEADTGQLNDRAEPTIGFRSEMVAGVLPHQKAIGAVRIAERCAASARQNNAQNIVTARPHLHGQIGWARSCASMHIV
jgi:hypothetical protein